jgi:hypothetical protein
MNPFDKYRIEPIVLSVQNGPPDLTVSIHLSTNHIMRAEQNQGPVDSSLVTIIVQNRLSFHPGPIVPGGFLGAFGSDVKGVMVTIVLSSGLQQVGGIAVPAGFQAAIAPNHQTVFCFGGDIPAGSSVNFEIEVIAVGGTYQETISAQVDPYSVIPEASETNNQASASIFVIWIN